MDPISNWIIYKRIGFFFFLFGKGILSCLFLHHRRYKLDHALETLQTTKVVDHTQWWTMMVVDVNAQKNYKAKEEEDPSPWMWATWFSPHHDTMTWHHSLLWRDYLIRYIASSLFALSHFHDINLSNNLFIGIWFANNQDSRIRQLLII